MIHHLRKGHSSVFLQYAHIGDTIGAKLFQVEHMGNVAVFRFTLSPVDGNQRSDEKRLLSEQLRQVHVSDDYLIVKLAQFVQRNRDSVKTYEMAIVSCGKTFRYEMTFGKSHDYMLMFNVWSIDR